MDIPYSNSTFVNPKFPYAVTPCVVPADELTRITIRGRFPQSDFRKKPVVRLETIPCDGLFSDNSLPGITMGNGFDMKRPGFEEIPFTLDETAGVISFTHRFRSEGEHIIRLCNANDAYAALSLFALKPDLFELRPFRGDMHIHSCFSGCNRDRATPEEFVASAANIGLDFMSLSDHKQLAPSRIAMAFTEKCACNIKAYPGEEVHLLDLHNHHLLNFGGNTDICDFMRDSPEAFALELKPYFDRIPSDMDKYVRELLATSGYLLDKIRADGGLSVLCHPFWKPAHRFYLPTQVLDFMFDENKFDALELVGCAGASQDYQETNQLTVAYWHSKSLQLGRAIPVVGNTDAHACVQLGQNCSIVFAKDNSLANIIAAVRANRSVACDQYPQEFPKFYGDFRLVKYAYFLRRAYYPTHDEISRREGSLMLDAITGDAPATGASFENLRAAMTAWNDSFWA